MNEHVFGEPLSVPVKLFNFALPAIAAFLTTMGLEIDWRYVALVLGSSCAGSLIFGYIQPEKRFSYQVYKGLISTVSGLVVGSYIVHRLHYEAGAEVGFAYFISSMLSLILMRTVVSLTEKNSRTFAVTILQRIFNVKLEDAEPETPQPRPRRQRGTRPQANVHITEEPGHTAQVVIPPGTTPDKVQVIEQTVIEKKEL